MSTQKKFDQVGFIMDYESGNLEREDVVAGFQELINSGVVWSLQGSYGTDAQRLIDAGECQRPTQESTPEPSSVGPYMHVVKDSKRMVGDEEYRILLYGAYNAMGLIGTEKNGIAILSEARMNVVTDEIGLGNSWYGSDPSPRLKEQFRQVMTMPDDDFVKMVNNSERCRYDIDAQKKKSSLRPNG